MDRRSGVAREVLAGDCGHDVDVVVAVPVHDPVEVVVGVEEQVEAVVQLVHLVGGLFEAHGVHGERLVADHLAFVRGHSAVAGVGRLANRCV